MNAVAKLADQMARVTKPPAKVEAPDIPFKPPGYYLLIRLFKTPEVTKGGIIRIDDNRDVLDTRCNIGEVLALGPDAYKDATRFPSGPWCRVGQMVGWKRYQDQRYKIRGQEYVVVADDKIDAVDIDPLTIG